MRGLFLLPGLLLGLLCHVESAFGFEINLYISPVGNDANSGRFQSVALATVAKAEEVVKTLWITNPTVDITILIAPGTYVGQSVQWKTVRSDRFIRFRALNPNNMPIFDGRGLAQSFFTLVWSGGRSNLQFEYLQIKNYLSAILLQGNLVNPLAFNSYNRISNCIFERIGNRYVFPGITAFSALGLTHSNNNKVTSNVFRNIDSDASGDQVHPIYVAHQSVSNEISNNRFESSTGDMIKIRDGSHFTSVHHNYFSNSVGKAAISHWYCENSNRGGCILRECPVRGTRAEYNLFKFIEIFNDPIIYNPANTGCNRVLPAVEPYILSRNADISNGTCEIRNLKGCPHLGILAGTWALDFLSEDAHRDPLACQGRAAAYYSSCSAKSLDTNDIFYSRYSINSALHFEGFAGQGCIVRAQNCARLGLKDRQDQLDFQTQGQTDPESCSKRASAWYSSCSRDDAAALRLVTLRYHQGTRVTSKTVGNGCVITASLCPRLDFEAGEAKLDSAVSAHQDVASCLPRAKDYWFSCTKNLINLPVSIKATFYDEGVEIDSKTFEGI